MVHLVPRLCRVFTIPQSLYKVCMNVYRVQARFWRRCQYQPVVLATLRRVEGQFCGMALRLGLLFTQCQWVEVNGVGWGLNGVQMRGQQPKHRYLSCFACGLLESNQRREPAAGARRAHEPQLTKFLPFGPSACNACKTMGKSSNQKFRRVVALVHLQFSRSTVECDLIHSFAQKLHENNWNMPKTTGSSGRRYQVFVR